MLYKHLTQIVRFQWRSVETNIGLIFILTYWTKLMCLYQVLYKLGILTLFHSNYLILVN